MSALCNQNIQHSQIYFRKMSEASAFDRLDLILEKEKEEEEMKEVEEEVESV